MVTLPRVDPCPRAYRRAQFATAIGQAAFLLLLALSCAFATQPEDPARAQNEPINQVPAELDNSVEHDAKGVPGLTPEKLLELIGKAAGPEKVGVNQLSINWLPDGTRLLACLPFREGRSTRVGIFVVDTRSGDAVRLGEGTVSRMSPDARRVAYFDSGGGAHVAALETSSAGRISMRELRTLASPGGKIAEFAWSPDSAALVYAFRPETSSAATTEWAEIQIRLARVDTGEDRVLYRAKENVRGLSWTRRGIVLARGRVGSRNSASTEYWAEISLLDPSTGELHRVVDKSGFDLEALTPSVAPDERHIAYGYDPFQVPPVTPITLPAIHDLETGATKTYALKSHYALVDGGGQWLGNSKAAVFPCKTGALFSSFCIFHTDGTAMRRLDKDALQEIGPFSSSRTGDQLAWLSENLLGSIQLQVSAPGLGGQRVLYSFERFDLAGIAIGRAQTVQWPLDAHLKLTGFLILPVNYVRGHRYPLVVDIHGGPTPGIRLAGSMLVTHPLEWQMWAAKGYAVLVVDYRKGGVLGLNEEYFHRTDGFLEDGDVSDVIRGIDEVVRMGVADSHRVGAIGHSYGALVLDWLVTHSDRLQAAVVKEGDPALWSGVKPGASLTTPLYHHYKAWYLGTDESHFAQLEKDNSALSYAYRVRTPVLWIAGDTGLTGRENLPKVYVDAINAGGGCARFMFFPDEGHVFVQPEHNRQVTASTLAWFDHWLKNGDGSPARAHGGGVFCGE